jgi:oxaloacetate decarboxylase beta subunit
MNFIQATGFYQIATGDWKVLIMMIIAFVLLYLAIVKKFEPLLLLPIAFGMLITNLPGAEMYHEILFAGGHVNWEIFGGQPITQEFMNHLGELGVSEAVQGTVSVGQTISVGLLDILYLGVKLGIYPCLIFMGVGAGTDFGPLIANPKTLLLGAAAQLGIFMTYAGCRLSDMIPGFAGFTAAEASSIGIIGGADGPTAIFVTSRLAPHLLGPIAVAAYSYMALVPVIQPPIMRALTSKEERQIVMRPLRQVSKREKILFPIVVTVFVALLVPSAGPLIACLMLGNLFKESGVVERLNKTAQNELMNIVTIFLGISVGATATATTFLSMQTIAIMLMGVVAFGFGTAGGVLLAKFMNLFLKEKINPLIGSAGVSAVPMAARVSQVEGQKANPANFLLMHAMGPNVAGVIGSAIAAGVLMALFG